MVNHSLGLSSCMGTPVGRTNKSQRQLTDDDMETQDVLMFCTSNFTNEVDWTKKAAGKHKERPPGPE